MERLKSREIEVFEIEVSEMEDFLCKLQLEFDDWAGREVALHGAIGADPTNLIEDALRGVVLRVALRKVDLHEVEGPLFLELKSKAKFVRQGCWQALAAGPNSELGAEFCDPNHHAGLGP